MKIAAEPQKFKFELSQLVNMRVSNECGWVQARAQYAHSENQYLIHYRAADGCARTNWYSQSVLDAVEDESHPGCQVHAAFELPERATSEA